MKLDCGSEANYNAIVYVDLEASIGSQYYEYEGIKGIFIEGLAHRISMALKMVYSTSK